MLSFRLKNELWCCHEGREVNDSNNIITYTVSVCIHKSLLSILIYLLIICETVQKMAWMTIECIKLAIWRSTNLPHLSKHLTHHRGVASFSTSCRPG